MNNFGLASDMLSIKVNNSKLASEINPRFDTKPLV